MKPRSLSSFQRVLLVVSLLVASTVSAYAQTALTFLSHYATGARATRRARSACTRRPGAASFMATRSRPA